MGRPCPRSAMSDIASAISATASRCGGTAYKFELTAERWKLLGEVNAFVNTSIKPESDQELYAVPERWEIPTSAGDCEDYVLLKQRYLEGLGFPIERRC